MKIGAPKEILDGENRVALTPQSAIILKKMGYECLVESGAGLSSRFTDTEYEDAGVKIVKTASALWKEADIVIKVRAPEPKEVKRFSEKQILISFIWPTQNPDLLKSLSQKGVSSLAMDMVPRISRAQKMDALSSMANIAGYRAVIEASNNFGRFFTGQITAAGKVPPAKVLVIGAGVAGLAAIGAAQSMGAIVRAFDVRPEVAEQIESMGAEFLFLDFSEDSSGDGGYAAPSSPEFRDKQLECFRRQAEDVDIVITTALIPGMDAPKLWLEDMVLSMKPGSVIVDLAAERGGNCELTQPDKKIETKNGVVIIGYTDYPSRMATQASTLYSNNIRHMLDDLNSGKNGKANIDMNDDVIRGATVTHKNKLTFPPPQPKIPAIAKVSQKKVNPQEEAERQKLLEFETLKKSGYQQVAILTTGGLLMLLIGGYAPTSFMQHFIVFVLSCFIGFQVIWNVSHALHTPLMAITNAISGIIILGALLQLNAGNFIVEILAGISVLIATINIVGGFLVTRRMLSMFQKS
jgi:NAD(P) transhydrogenase subunit alpha